MMMARSPKRGCEAKLVKAEKNPKRLLEYRPQPTWYARQKAEERCSKPGIKRLAVRSTTQGLARGFRETERALLCQRKGEKFARWCGYTLLNTKSVVWLKYKSSSFGDTNF